MIENDFPEVDPKFFYNQKEKSEKQPRLPNETIKYYNENPGTYTVVYSTDMVESLLEDITQLLN